MSQKITVIGGSGFVGTNLCCQFEKARQDFEIIDLKSSARFPHKYKKGDIRNIQSLREAISGQIVIHLAAVHRDDVRDADAYYSTNVLGTENVASVCSELGIKKIVFTSTVAVYGFAQPGTDEAGRINPFNEYGKTKFIAEEKLRLWQLADNNSLIIVRPTVIFGKGNRGNVYNLLAQIASGKFVMVGPGTNKKSMAYVGNVAAFLCSCISTDQKYALYNYIDTPDLTMNDLVSYVRQILLGKSGVGVRIPYWMGMLVGHCADFFAKFTGKMLPISSIRVKKFTANTEFKSSKSDLDGFKPPYELSEGLTRTIDAEFINPDKNREIFFTE